jgi:hypothetical protein
MDKFLSEWKFSYFNGQIFNPPYQLIFLKKVQVNGNYIEIHSVRFSAYFLLVRSLVENI